MASYVVKRRVRAGGTLYGAGETIPDGVLGDRAAAKMVGRGDIAYGGGAGGSVPATVVHSSELDNIVQLTQAAYDALGTKDARTLYVIV